ncbi:GTP pyrophosphokinase [Blautia sp.]|uniref:GTP pyrophosphokinase n=1 Tax=Blautia sp. TaxID=1955243 RepID=UPI003AB25B5F
MSKKKSKKIRKEQAQELSSAEPEHPKLAAEKTAAIASYIKDPDYRLRCKAAIDILMAKLKMINAELSGQKKRTVISQITNRIKSAESIYAKLLKKGLEPDFETARKNLKDLIGIRVVCPFEDELYQVAESLEMQKDIENVRIKDYIKNPKKNGYKSLHLIVKVSIYSAEGEQKELVEIQLRTIAMDYWSVLEYELYYKKRDNAEIETELKKYAEEIANLDHRMLELRNKIEKI